MKHQKQKTNTNIGHVWLRFKRQDRTNYFIDPTYGQINRRLNRIIVDKVDQEHDYFQYCEQPQIITETVKAYYKEIEHLYRELATSSVASQRLYQEKLDNVYKSLTT